MPFVSPTLKGCVPVNHVLTNAKAYVALAGSIATALLAVYGPETGVGQVLTVVSVVATAVGTWAVPNAKTPPPAVNVVIGGNDVTGYVSDGREIARALAKYKRLNGK